MPKGKVVTKPEQLAMPDASVQKTDEFEAWVVQQADYFTVAMKMGPGRVQRWEFPTLRSAIAFASDSPRKMVYAVMNVGRSIMIGPKQYHQFLVLRGESLERKKSKVREKGKRQCR
jgi:hypothetical protein